MTFCGTQDFLLQRASFWETGLFAFGTISYFPNLQKKEA
jgi:hypothetical protein